MQLKERLGRLAFSYPEFEKANKVDRIRMSMIDNKFVLKDFEENYAKKLHDIFHILSESTRQTEAVRKIRNVFPELSGTRVYQALQDVQNLYGNVMQRNREFDLVMHRERLLRHIVTCEDNEEYDNVARLEKLLFDVEKELAKFIPKEDPSLPKMPRIMLSSDAALLKALPQDEEE
jgi:hypothetical protein